MDRSLIYVSRRLSSAIAPELEVEAIVAEARLHNQRAGITGALACTPQQFAQLLEGPAAALEELMRRIDRDPRHTGVTILRIEAISRRRVPGWSMAYSGNSTYVSSHILPLICQPVQDNAMRIERLIALLVGLANEGAAQA